MASSYHQQVTLVILVKIAFLFTTMTLARVERQKPHALLIEGRVTCLDCAHHHHHHPNYDLSGIKVVVKCDGVDKLGVATTVEDGSFQAHLPSSPSSVHMNCVAKIIGATTQQLYVSKRDTCATNHQHHHESSNKNIMYLDEPLKFYSSLDAKNHDEFDASKTVDLPVPREWGIAPTSYYLPFIPIIGIP